MLRDDRIAAAGRIFTLVGADKLIPIYPTLEAALAGPPAAPAGTGLPEITASQDGAEDGSSG